MRKTVLDLGATRKQSEILMTLV